MQAATQSGLTLAGVLGKTTVNIFWSPGGNGSKGISFSYGVSTGDATSNVTVTRTYYWQLLPRNNEVVPFR